MKNLIIVLLLFFVVSCDNDAITEPNPAYHSFNIFLVKEGQLEIYSHSIDINSLELESQPWIKSADIDFYDWSAHSFYLNKEVEKGEHSGRHFVVTSGEKRLVVGIFWPMIMSSFPNIPTITPEDGFFSPKDVIRFGRFGLHRPGGLNENLEFKSELISAGILKEGIKVEITSIQRISTSTLKYSYTVKNLDSDNVYIIDPQKMGSSNFHYYTNGVSLEKNGNYYWPNNFASSPSEEIKSEWYSKLQPGKSKSSTVELSGYSALPTGKVNASFNFPGANLKNTGEWKKPDGRIWLGDFIAKAELTIR